MTTINAEAVLSYFSGKARVNAEAALPILLESIAQGYWVKGVSRKVVAALSKVNVAAKKAGPLRDVPTNFRKPETTTYSVYSALAYGIVRADPINFAAIEAEHPELAEVLAYARAYVAAAKPVWDAIRVLDATRPPALFTTMQASPTVSATLKDLGAVSVTVCPLEFDRVESVVDGQTVISHVARLVWPEGTKHNTSRFASRFSCCAACGHKISNGFNWVPLILETDDAPPSFWVGRDCAKTLFGVDMTGDLEIAGETHRPARA